MAHLHDTARAKIPVIYLEYVNCWFCVYLKVDSPKFLKLFSYWNLDYRLQKYLNLIFT